MIDSAKYGAQNARLSAEYFVYFIKFRADDEKLEWPASNECIIAFAN